MWKYFGNINNTKRDLIRLLKAYKEIIDINTICSVTDPAGKIIYVNDKFCNISKYTKEELLGIDHRIVNSNYHPSSMFKELWDTIQSGKVWRSDVKSRAKDGTFFWLDSTIVPLRDENGIITAYFSLRIPIDDRKKIEEEQKEYVKNLEKMLFMVSHEVRHPISQILGIVQLINEADILDVERSEMISNLKDSATNLDLFTKKLTSFMHEMRLEAESSSDSGWPENT